MRPILVTGAPRSGTSLTAEVLARCGAWTGEVNDLWENTAIRDGVVKPRLAPHMDPLGRTSFADVTTNPAQLRREVVGVLQAQRYAGGPWLYKDAKLLFMVDAWREAFPDAVWVAVWRDPEAIAASVAERWAPRDPEALVAQYHERLAALDALPVRPGDLARGWTDDYRAVCRVAGMEWTDAANVFDAGRWSR